MKVVGILGISFCGSTIFGIACNAYPKCFHVGEISNLTDKFSDFLTDRTNQNYRDCFCSVCIETKEKKCDFFTDFTNFRNCDGIFSRIESKYKEIIDPGGLDIIVDSSKTPSWFRFSEFSNPGLQFEYVFLVKDPIHQALSYFNRKYYPWQEKNELPSPQGYMNFWHFHNSQIFDWLENGHRDYSIVLYDDFVANPTKILEKSLGIDYHIDRDNLQLKINSAKHHYILGNGKFSNLNKAIRMKYCDDLSEVKKNWEEVPYKIRSAAYSLFGILSCSNKRIM